MSLYDLQLTKDYLRIQHSVEDSLLNVLGPAVIAKIESYLRRPILVRSLRFTDEGLLGPNGALKTLLVPITPIASITSIIHDDEEEIDTDETAFNPKTGKIRYLSGDLFRAGPWNIVARVGLEADHDYQYYIEPALKLAVLDTIADAYHKRNPAASDEREGGGLWVTYDSSVDIPRRVMATIAPFRMPLLAI